jgi:hypothetical protein
MPKQNIDGHQGGSEGQSQVPEHVQSDVPLSFTSEIDVDAVRHVPGNVTAIVEERPSGKRSR